MILSSLLKGFGASSGLIMAIGAQNAFVIRQGLQRQHLFLTAMLCSIIDALLIVLGTFGFGGFILEHPFLLKAVKYFAVIFLFSYGVATLMKTNVSNIEGTFSSSTKATVLSILALSLLNPHVYLDTVILLGSIATQQPEEEQRYFVAGAILASFIWFFGITYGARFLAFLFQNETTRKAMDILIALTMWAIALTILI